ncbi:Hypothetical protein AA314_04434 [Archangium gephyra]|uniref:Uncharacterized protein n=1 Tax=Archangium gephyra TaxID=48 RepID=A0AAC8Q860_9BACT|nr:Hypothetical protein AA314_04434 [Archangium gephyra]
MGNRRGERHCNLRQGAKRRERRCTRVSPTRHGRPVAEVAGVRSRQGRGPALHVATGRALIPRAQEHQQPGMRSEDPMKRRTVGQRNRTSQGRVHPRPAFLGTTWVR